jgi:hypothetical protein
MNWIADNIDTLADEAAECFRTQGHGALAIKRWDPDNPDLPMFYMAAARMPEGDQRSQRIVRDYDPEAEMVIMLVKPDDAISIYRIGRPKKKSHAAEA